MELVIKNKCIDAPINVILKTLKSELKNGKLKDIGEENNSNIPVTCPVHKDGFERHPSCQVYTKRDNEKVEYGYCHCFSCGWYGSLNLFVNACFDESDENFGKQWLLDRFGTNYSENIRYLPKIELNKKVDKSQSYLDESILDKYSYYHPYMWKRKLSKEIVDTFRIGFDKTTNMITFPVWDYNNNLVMMTYRSINDKRFFIDEEKDKPVYLLNFIKNWGIKSVYVTESQINALTLWSWGYPAIALIGTGSKEQMQILNKCAIRSYVLCFDGDEAGDKGIKRFQKNIRKDVLVSQKVLPRGKDVNDLTKEEFDSLYVI